MKKIYITPSTNSVQLAAGMPLMQLAGPSTMGDPAPRRNGYLM